MQKPKGTYDLLPKDSKLRNRLEEILKTVSLYYNFKEIRTPIFERSEVFHRAVGDSTDIVKKETYDFLDRGNRQMTLRPEGTATVVRAYVENKLFADPIQPQKLYYIAPMFRYERPQAGRYRQHHQFGCEVFGADSPSIDAEIISMAYNIYQLLGISDLTVKVNSLGDEESRTNYQKALVQYLTPLKDKLCIDCQERIKNNPLRVLDCKIDTFDNPPKMSEYRTAEAKKYFAEVLSYLNTLNIKYEVDEKLVRGLDYYTHTVFEIHATIEGFGAQTALGGGGRYNKMVKQFGGPDVSAIGFGLGIERMLLALQALNINLVGEDYINVFVATMANTKNVGIKLLNELRLNGFIAEISHQDKSLKNQLRQANKLNAETVLIVGEEELENNLVIIKYKGEQKTVQIDKVVEYLDKLELGDYNE